MTYTSESPYSSNTVVSSASLNDDDFVVITPDSEIHEHVKFVLSSDGFIRVDTDHTVSGLRIIVEDGWVGLHTPDDVNYPMYYTYANRDSEQPDVTIETPVDPTFDSEFPIVPVFQFARPDEDLFDALGIIPDYVAWTTSPLWSKLDEVTASDSDYIQAIVNGGGADDAAFIIMGLTTIVDPGVNTQHTLRVRARVLVGSITETGGIALYIYDDSLNLLIDKSAILDAIDTSWQDFDWELSAEEAATLNNKYDELAMGIGVAPGGTGSTIQVSQVYLKGSWRMTEVSDAKYLGMFFSLVQTLADDATPSVEGGEIWITGGTTTITDFDDGIAGQNLEILAAHSVTITDGTNILLHGSANFDMVAGDVLILRMFNDQVWEETSRKVN